jgi:hypothetical protein
MLLFALIILAPACLFFLYALVRFWREARLLRPSLRPALPWCVTPLSASPVKRQIFAQEDLDLETNHRADARTMASGVSGAHPRHAGARNVA